MTLTVKQIERLTKPGRHLDRDGLYLQVSGNGAKSWILRFQLGEKANGKPKERFMGLGSLKAFNLDEARKRARKQRQLLADKIDPIEARRATLVAARNEKASVVIFGDAVKEFLAAHEGSWRSAKHTLQWKRTLELYARALNDRAVAAIDGALINQVLAPIWPRIPATASRVKLRIEKVVEWIKSGRPLPKSDKGKIQKHHPAMPYADVPAFLVQLKEREGITPLALRFCILTGVRTSEALKAQWSEFDLTTKTWVIPAARTKTGKQFRVPLSAAALEVLAQLPGRDVSGDYVFVGATAGKPLNDAAMLILLRTIRMGISVHGFRSSLRDYLAERMSTPNHVAEMCLAHTVKGVEAAYRRGDLLELRRPVMERWAQYCCSPASEVAVVQLRSA